MDDQRRPSPTGSVPERRASRAAAWLAAGLAVAVVLAPIDSRAADARSLLPEDTATSPTTAGTAWRTAVERSELKAVSLDDGLPLIAYAFTAARWKGRGLGSALLQLSLNALAASGHRHAHLWVTAGNVPA